jgi:hypothetical protein
VDFKPEKMDNIQNISYVYKMSGNMLNEIQLFSMSRLFTQTGHDLPHIDLYFENTFSSKPPTYHKFYLLVFTGAKQKYNPF